MQVGFFTQFFSLPFELIGHLAIDSFCVQLWSELEPKGLILQPAIGCTWTPVPLCEGDIPLNLLPIQHYDSHGSSIINNYCMFLHLISIYDLLIYNSTSIHPEYFDGILPLSQSSKITWPPIPRPPPKNIGHYGTNSSDYTSFHC
jgi:hypothetical protein